MNAFEIHGVSKSFGRTRALIGLDLNIEAGTVHALVGMNGAGKSTCLGVISGRVTPDRGNVSIFGEEVKLGDIRAIRNAGVAVIYQELSIVGTLSTQSNVFLGQELSSRGVIRNAQMRRAVETLGERLGVTVPLDIPASHASIGDQQLLEIMRALLRKPRIILFDEPTAALAAREKEALFRVIHELREQGITSVFVSHNFDDVLAVADVVTVFREGRAVATRPRRAWAKDDLVRAVIGHDLAPAHALGLSSAATDAASPLVRVEDLSVPGALHSVAFDIRHGEVLGLAGLVGSGRSTLLRALAGDLHPASGRLWIDGEEVRWPRSVRRARATGFALVSEDRGTQGLFKEMSALDNIVISDLRRVSRMGVFMPRSARAEGERVARSMRVDPERMLSRARMLSGGNQQKLMLARWGYSPPRVLLADEFARGVDIGAKQEIGQTLRTVTHKGMSVVAVSSEFEDLEPLCDRVLVLADGRIVGELSDPAEMTAANMLALAFSRQAAHV
jgi:ABC-type sugar transport system ATPase subunit